MDDPTGPHSHPVEPTPSNPVLGQVAKLAKRALASPTPPTTLRDVADALVAEAQRNRAE